MVEIFRYDENFDDWPELLSLLNKAFAYMESRISPPSSLHRLTAQSIAQKALDGELLLARDNTTLVGCVFIEDREDVLYVGKLAVSEKYRNKGIATNLLAACMEMAREKGKEELELQTRIELIENHAYFRSQGFRKTGDTTHEGFDQPTSITMRYRLAP